MVAIVRVVGAVLWSILLISSSLIVLLVTFKRSLPVAMARLHWSPGILWICGIQLKVEGLDHIDPNQPYVFVSNHQSYLDIPVLFRALPVNLHFVAKKELKKIPFLGWYMIATGMIFIDRSDRKKSIASLEKAARLIHQGKNVLMFPEGTRSRDGKVAGFKKGPFMLACQAEVPVLPVGIYVEGEGFRLNKLKSTRITVKAGDPLDTQTPSVATLIKDAQNQVALLAGKETE